MTTGQTSPDAMRKPGPAFPNLPPEDPMTPSGCRHCGIGQREHMQRWTTGVGWHQWSPPTQDQIKTRMRQRAAERKTR